MTCTGTILIVDDQPAAQQVLRGLLVRVDTGIGIDDEHLCHIFERFYRVKAEQKIRGTGLGLSISRKLIELHGGHIAVASSPGQGSTFAIYLPLRKQDDPNGVDYE